MALKDRPRSYHGIATPVKGIGQRFAYAGLVALSFVLLLAGRVDVYVADRFRAIVADAVAPVLDVASRPVAAASEFLSDLDGVFSLLEENTTLRDERDRLLHWQMVARKLDAENRELRSLLAFSPVPEESFISARVIGDAGGAFVHSLLLNAGSREGVQKGQAVITGEGLAGRVVSVGARSSRALLITDLNSRIPVLVESSRTRAILAGNNRDLMKLLHLPPGAGAIPGERIVTSGHGGALPPGVPVGIVVSEGERIAVRPFVARERIEYVRIVNYGLKDIFGALPDGNE